MHHGSISIQDSARRDGASNHARQWNEDAGITTGSARWRSLFGRGLRGGARQPHIGTLLAQEDFDRELHRHRACADRYGWHFVLLSFEVGRWNREAREVLAQVIRDRMRAGDLAGWREEKGVFLSLLLPGTPCEKAVHVIYLVEREFRARMQRLYPSNSPPELSCNVFPYSSANTRRGLKKEHG